MSRYYPAELRRLFALESAFSLLPCAAAVVLWVRSYRRIDVGYLTNGADISAIMPLADGRAAMRAADQQFAPAGSNPVPGAGF